jgi:hypothetical protein
MLSTGGQQGISHIYLIRRVRRKPGSKNGSYDCDQDNHHANDNHPTAEHYLDDPPKFTNVRRCFLKNNGGG